MKALIIGATGATGKDLVDVLLKDSEYSKVVIFVRRSSGLTHPKLVEVITDFDKLEDVQNQINGDVWFSCLGTTLKAAGSKENQWKIDYEIPMKFGVLAKRNGVACVVLLSAYGASTTSNVFYSKMKGQLKTDLTNLSFLRCIIFKPGLLLRENTDRVGERVSAILLKFANSLGLFRKFRPLPTSTLSEQLAKAPKVLTGVVDIVELDEIFRL